jgi:hypothetical protein
LEGCEAKIQNLQNQANSLQQKIIELGNNQTLNFKKALSELLKRSQAFKIDQQDGFYTLEANKGSYLDGNTRKVYSEVKEVDKLDSNLFS